MPSLAQTQAAFSAALAARDGAPAGLAGDERGARRFALYRNNVRLARMNAVRAAYPVIRNIVGEEFFEGLAREYALHHESASGDLNEYGARFGVFLAGFAPAAELPYLPEVARMEWQAHLVYYAADNAAFDAARLAALTETQWGALRFRLQSTVHADRYAYPVARIWEVNQPGYAGEMQIDLQPGAHYALIHRPLYDVQVTALDAAGHALIAALAQDRPLSEALVQAAAAQPDFDSGAALQFLLQNALIRDFSFEDAPS